MNAYLDWVRHPLLDAVGAALLHFLWQGALVAGALAIALRSTRHASANTRYALCSSALLLMFLLPLSTAIQVYWSAPEFVQFHASQEFSSASRAGDAILTPVPDAESSASSTADWAAKLRTMDNQIARWRPVTVVLWMLGLVYYSIRLLGGLYAVSRLKRNSTPLIDPMIDTMFPALMAKMGIERPVQLHTSSRVVQPMLIGWLKPVILFPTSMLSGLPPNHVEAILAHELAHIRRHDYFFLLAQSVMETLFFYHPAVWWVSAQMRIEREYGCDDEAVAALENEAVYVRALVSLETGRLASRKIGLAAGDGRLVDRIRRLVDGKKTVPQPRPVHRASWATLAILVLCCSTLIVACERTSLSEDDSLLESQYKKALTLTWEGNYSEAKQLAEQAARAGNICAMKLLAEMLYPDKHVVGRRDGTVEYPVEWIGQNEEESRYWAEAFERALREEADGGRADAMLWLSLGYNSKMGGLYSLSHLEKNDSLSQVWLDWAVAARSAIAKRQRAIIYRKEGNFEEAHRLFEEAALAGDGHAFRFWALMYIDTRAGLVDPARHFEIASLAVDHQAPGIHEWLGNELEDLQREMGQDNEEARRYMAIVDSLNLVERLASVPETPIGPWMPLLCE